MTPPDHLDLDLGRGDREPETPLRPDPSPARRILVIGGAVVLGLLAVGLWFWWSAGREDPASTAGQAVSDGSVAEERAPLGSGDALALPPLGSQLDPVVRGLLSGLSARPELARLLATDGLVRRFVTSVDGIARGRTPSRQVAVLRPDGPLSIDRGDHDGRISDASFSRYDGLAATVEDLDPEDLARLYGQLKPRLDDAHAELGGGGSFDAAMERAIVHLLSVNPEFARGTVRPAKGVVYEWTDASTENLSSAQKHVLRMGPGNARRVQAKLRAFAEALGIPAQRLPASS